MTQAIPASPTSVATHPAKVYQFEGIGWLEKRADIEALDSDDSEAQAQKLFAAIAAKFAAYGFTALVKAYVTEDDEQGDTEVKHFVVVALLGHSDIAVNESASRALSNLLTEVSAATCCDSSHSWLLNPEDWELVSIDDPD